MRWISVDSQPNCRLPSTATRQRGINDIRLIRAATYQGIDLPGKDSPIGARLGAALQYAGVRVAQNNLSATKADGVGNFNDVVAASGQGKR